MASYESAGESDEWYTPRYIFDAIGLMFDMDVASPSGGPRHVPTKQFLTKSDDGLCCDWHGKVWMNPPFGHQRQKMQWLEKFFRHGNGVALLPDRTSAPWFQKYVPLSDAVCFVSPKVKFERPDGTLGASPGTGTVLLASGASARDAIRKCGLGMVMHT